MKYTCVRYIDMCMRIYVSLYIDTYLFIYAYAWGDNCISAYPWYPLSHTLFGIPSFLDGYCSTVQGLLDWFEVDLGFTELPFIQIDLCVLYVFVLYSRVSLSLCPFLDILHCLPRAVGVPLESALNLVSPMSPCGAHDTHACCARSNDHLLYLLW